ncbi:MAG: protein kinase, partial [Cyanobacteria bacterium J06642_11]
MKTDKLLHSRYQIQQELNCKPGRKTLLATDVQTQNRVVVKILQFHQLFQWDDLKLFEREANILKTLDYPAIPRYLDFFETEVDGNHSFVLVQEYIEAPSLESVIQSGRRFSVAETQALAEKLLIILNHLHSKLPPIIHRDIKPSNILLANCSS